MATWGGFLVSLRVSAWVPCVRAVAGVASPTGTPPPAPLSPTVDAGPLRPGGGAAAAALLRDAGDGAHPQGGVRGPTALPGLLREARPRGPLCSEGRGGARSHGADARACRCRYKVLMRGAAGPQDAKGRCAALLELYDASRGEWQLGRTKVGLAEGARRPGRPPPGRVLLQVPDVSGTRHPRCPGGVLCSPHAWAGERLRAAGCACADGLAPVLTRWGRGVHAAVPLRKARTPARAAA